MKQTFTILLLSIILLSLSVSAQTPAIGQWRTHLPYQKVISTVSAGSIVYAATPYSMFTYNPTDNAISLFGKVQGLHDMGISKIDYNKTLQIILVAYTDANIDLIDNKGIVYNIPDIYNKEMSGIKTINNILFSGSFAYLSCSFGIVKVDLKKQEIKETYFFENNGSSINVFDMTENDTSLFAATETGIYYASKTAFNLADFSRWHHYSKLPDSYGTYNLITDFNGKIYTNYYSGGWDGDTLYSIDTKGWHYFRPGNNERHHQIKAIGNELFLVNRYSVKVFNDKEQETAIVANPLGEGFQPLSVYGSGSDLWIGTEHKGLLHARPATNNYEYIMPNGPGSNLVFDLDAYNDQVWVVPGGYQFNWSKSYIHDGIFSFTDGKWTTFNSNNVPALDTITDMVCVKINPFNPEEKYVGTWQSGIIKFSKNKFETIFSKNNSSLEPWLLDPKLINVSGIDFDSYKNMWVANSGAYDILSVKMETGTWKHFYLGNTLSGIDIGKLMVDRNDNIWITKRKNGMVIVYNYNGTPADASDDRVKVLGSVLGNGNIHGSSVFSMATDLNGEVWIGTDKGISVFYSPENIFQPGNNYDAQQILVPRNDGSGLADILLVTETVTAIAVDGGNRKWIGTQRAGIFLLSPDGLKQIHHFTSKNSPLLSNNITGIAIDKTGEVFIGTSNGLISYRGTATPGNKINSNIYAFPNPVRPDYSGPIAIKGLVSNASVKITDVHGNLVYETQALGGQAIWNGETFGGKRVATGVYLVFITNADGSQKMVTKILFVH